VIQEQLRLIAQQETARRGTTAPTLFDDHVVHFTLNRDLPPFSNSLMTGELSARLSAAASALGAQN
jgi:hypothetical protein